VAGVAVAAAVASYEHANALVRAHGEAGWTGRLVPLTVDGLIYASSMVMLDSARRKVPVPALARWLLGLGIAATLVVPDLDPVEVRAAQVFADEIATDRVPAPSWTGWWQRSARPYPVRPDLAPDLDAQSREHGLTRPRANAGDLRSAG
jgi:Protein of unknown function (DUF2637)